MIIDHNNFEISIVRTNKLHCGKCKRKLHIGNEATFSLSITRGFLNVFHNKCSPTKPSKEIDEEERHIFDLEL